MENIRIIWEDWQRHALFKKSSKQWDCHKCSLALLDREWDVALVVPVSSKETFAHELEAHTWMIYDHMVTWGSNFSRERLRQTINMVSYRIHFLAILMLIRVPESQFLPLAISVHLLEPYFCRNFANPVQQLSWICRNSISASISCF